MKFDLKAGVSIDVLTKDELDSSLRDYFAQAETAKARGLKPIIVEGNSGTIQISATTGWPIEGPRQGYSWGLRFLGLNLGSAQTIQAWKTGDNLGLLPSQGLIGSAASSQFPEITWSNIQGLIRGGEYVTLFAGAATVVGYRLVAIEVPTELEWKIK